MTDIKEIIGRYNTGQFTIAQLAKDEGICTVKMYYLLRDAGCVFNRKRRKPVSDAERERRSKAHKGCVISEAARKAVSEANSCNYNGLNGYGHTKVHNRGYILAYVPKHPHAHKDGYVMMHTVIMERHIGRYLNDNEVVHHINHDKTDNRIENLMLMDKKEHMSMHMKERQAKRRNDILTA
jgi:hypothetical protein